GRGAVPGARGTLRRRYRLYRRDRSAGSIPDIAGPRRCGRRDQELEGFSTRAAAGSDVGISACLCFDSAPGHPIFTLALTMESLTSAMLPICLHTGRGVAPKSASAPLNPVARCL